MKHGNEKGFSLIELLIVVVIIGVVAALAVPAFQRGKIAAENRSVHATLKTMKTTQAMFFSQNQRFARLDELNAVNQNGLGDSSTPPLLYRNGFTFEMSPSTPTDADLRRGYQIAAYRDAGGLTWRFELSNENIIRAQPSADDVME